ncbi:MAG TPA: PilZ domain-containing protein [Acidimicrobiales bacterium]|nr:PilZ domain-containing protein [Acidimicrobiales bacterium]
METLLDQYQSVVPAPAALQAAQLRRSVPRQPVAWTAKCRLRGDPDGEWRVCLISDISPAGAGLRLAGVTPGEVKSRGIEVMIQLGGEVRNANQELEDVVRIGIEFADISGDAADFLDSLKRSGTRW